MGKYLVFLLVLVMAVMAMQHARADNLEDCELMRDADRKIRCYAHLLKAGRLSLKDQASAYTKRGSAYAERDQFDLAIADYTRAIELNPRHAEAYNNRGFAHYMMDQFDLAIADYTRAIELNPNDASAYNNRGLAYDGNSQFELAIADYTRAIRLDPRYADAYGNRGIGFHRIGQNDRAIADFRRALELDPSDKQIRRALKNLGAKP